MENTKNFNYKVQDFSGPLDLLLSLIYKKKLDISILSLTKVTDEFLSFVNTLQNKDYMDEVAEYIEIASTLYSLKIASLLPGINNEVEADLELIEKRNLLFSRLIQYKTFKDLSIEFGEILTKSNAIFSSRQRFTKIDMEEKIEVKLGVNRHELRNIASSLIFSKKEIEPQISHLLEQKASIKDESHSLLHLLKKSKTSNFSFNKFIKKDDKTIVIVAKFMAVLELFRINFISISQKKMFGDIDILLNEDVSKMKEEDINKEMSKIGV